ncbi:MAG: ABC transporter ATP-binding protein/permease, partial [Acetatifactor sp.]|nr:ABC transporter ATP-binding protein/permease [Acetatifactor sp.]
VNYMTQVLFALGMVSNILNSAVRAVASSARVQEILDEVPAQREVDDTADVCVENEDLPGSILFRQVSFAYAGTARPAVQGADFSVREGETIGIIGPTGSGKSTLVNLVPRFYDATQGQVLVGGRDVTRMPIAQLRRMIAVVPQKALLFTGTIQENLRWGDKQATLEEIRRAAEAACAEEFVSKLPEGYDTQLGQGGVNISGGQKQRLSIARALLKKPQILILDDCTSALDATTEAKVLAGIRRESAGMTVLLVSQRISTVMKADHILCMEDGRICGFGSHEELMADCEPYRAIYRSQIGDSLAETEVKNTEAQETAAGSPAPEYLAAEERLQTKGGSIHG